MQASFNGLEQHPHSVAIAWDLNLTSLIASKIDHGECLTALVEDVLSHIEGTLQTLGAERPSGQIGGIRVRTR